MRYLPWLADVYTEIGSLRTDTTCQRKSSFPTSAAVRVKHLLVNFSALTLQMRLAVASAVSPCMAIVAYLHHAYRVHYDVHHDACMTVLLLSSACCSMIITPS